MVEIIPEQSRESPLDLIDRVSEILFGLIMVLTFTGSMSVAEIGREDIREMFIGAIGCNFAWGLIDALMFIVVILTTRGRNIQLLKALRRADQRTARRIISDALPGRLGQVMEPAQLDGIRGRLLTLDDSAFRYAITWSEIRAAVVVFALVFLSTFPVVIPFLFLTDAYLALRLSNLVAVTMLFTMGYLLGRHAGRRGVLWGIAMAAVGSIIVSITIFFGG